MILRRTLVLGAIVALISGGCGTQTASPPVRAASGPAVDPSAGTAAVPTAGTAADAPEPWPQALIAQPSAVTSAPSLLPGYQCHPCHFLAENEFLGIGQTADGPIAVGVQEPPAQAIAFTSTDGTHWTPLAGFTGAEGTTAVAATSDGVRTVIVGQDSHGATSWSGSHGAWTQAPRQAALDVAYAAGGMTTVTAFDGGFVAGGYRDDPLHAASAAGVWRSADGLTWRLDDGSGSFAGGRIWGIAAHDGTLVAVGTNGDPNYGPAGAWRWTAAAGWQRAAIGPDAGGAMRAVVATAFGFVAVGLNGNDDGARAWTSTDGSTWTAVADQPAFHYYSLPLRMQSLVAGPGGLVAGGWRSDAGKGSAVTWTSADGLTWQTPTWEPSFSGAQISGLAISNGMVVAVGRDGYPDWNQAAIWVRGGQ